MERYDYHTHITEDIRDYIRNEIDRRDYAGQPGGRDTLEDLLNDILWTHDSVTGNGSGSYTFSTWEAEENLCHNLDLLQEALEEFSYDFSYLLKKGAESADVTIRCYLLGQCIGEVLDDLEEEGFFDVGA